jgi:hypothetical protein
MTPAMNHHTLPSPTARVSRAARPANPTAHHGAAQRPGISQHTIAVQPSSLGRRTVRPATLAESDYVANPFCERCGTDEFIYLESFVPATHHRDGSISKLAEVTYFCSGCDDYSAHAVPASWAPPGWYFG